MGRNAWAKSPPSSNEEQTSSGNSSEESNSTPNTPPSPHVEPDPVTPPQVSVPPQASRYSPVTPPPPIAKRSPPKSTPKSRLGAIDEDSEAVSPDIPERNPLRRMGIPSKFFLPSIPTLYGTRRPHKNLYDDVEGPKGEKFSDMRNNKKTKTQRGCGWRTLVCLACLVLILIAALAIGLIVGLKVRHNKKEAQQIAGNSTGTGLNAGFPAGQYSIASYLNEIDTAWTAYPTTWMCYPGQTYNQSASASLSTLSWNIAAQKDGKYLISSADPTFSYPFQNVPLNLTNNGTDNEYWTFTTLWDKVVIPSASLTTDGTTSRCYYHNTSLTGRLYTKKAKAEALQNSTSGSSTKNQPWPYALFFYETHASGSGVPDCYEYVNGQNGRNLNLTNTVANTGSSSNCGCQYTDFFPVPQV